MPAYAAVDDAVGAVRRVAGGRVAGFANRVLRALAASGEPPLPDRADLPAYLATVCSMPAWLVEELTSALAEDEWEPGALALTAPAPLWARIDRGRIQPEDLARLLAGERAGATAEESPLCVDAVRISGAGSPDASRSFQDGLWTVQDLGAQIVARMVGAQPGQRILDACAGVGGKSTHLAQITGDRAIIDAADQSERKLDLLTDAARRLGLTSIRPIASDLRRPGPELAADYDAILLDAPCSGLGVLRRHPELKWRSSPAAVAELAALQRELLEALWRARPTRRRAGLQRVHLHRRRGSGPDPRPAGRGAGAGAHRAGARSGGRLGRGGDRRPPGADLAAPPRRRRVLRRAPAATRLMALSRNAKVRPCRAES